MNELELFKEKVASVVTPEVDFKVGTITFDLSILNDKVKELVETVKNEKVTIDTIKEYKELKAKLNHLYDEINNKKIKIVKEYSKPVDEFTAQVKANLTLLKEGAKSIDDQIKEFENQEKENLKESYEKYWDTLKASDHVPFVRIESQDFYKKSMSRQKVEIAINKINEEIIEGVKAIKNHIEDKNECDLVLEKYYSSLDYEEEIAEYNRWKNIIKNEPKPIEKAVEVTTPKETENVAEPKIEAKKEEIIKPVVSDKVYSVIITLHATDNEIEHIEEMLNDWHLDFNLRKQG